jgi:hypothetical protein
MRRDGDGDEGGSAALALNSHVHLLNAEGDMASMRQQREVGCPPCVVDYLRRTCPLQSHPANA